MNALDREARELTTRASDLESLETFAANKGDLTLARLAQDCARACKRALVDVYTVNHRLAYAGARFDDLPF